MSGNVWVKSGKVLNFFPESGTLQTGDGTSNLIYKDSPLSTIQATVRGSGSVATTVKIYGTNSGSTSESVLIGTINLSGSAPQTDGFAMDAPWKQLYAVISGTSGTVTAINVYMGV